MVGLWRTTMGTMAAAVLATGVGSGPASAQDGSAPAPAASRGESPSQWQIWDILDRLLERTLPEDGRSVRNAPGFVVDPGWPLSLPNKWLVGQVQRGFALREAGAEYAQSAPATPEIR